MFTTTSINHKQIIWENDHLHILSNDKNELSAGNLNDIMYHIFIQYETILPSEDKDAYVIILMLCKFFGDYLQIYGPPKQKEKAFMSIDHLCAGEASAVYPLTILETKGDDGYIIYVNKDDFDNKLKNNHNGRQFNALKQKLTNVKEKSDKEIQNILTSIYEYIEKHKKPKLGTLSKSTLTESSLSTRCPQLSLSNLGLKSVSEVLINLERQIQKQKQHIEQLKRKRNNTLYNASKKIKINNTPFRRTLSNPTQAIYNNILEKYHNHPNKHNKAQIMIETMRNMFQ